MRNRRWLLVAALGVMLGVLPVRPAAGQYFVARPPSWGGALPAAEVSYTHVRFTGEDGRLGTDGIGARLMWRPSGTVGATATLRDRTDVGVWATYTPERVLDPGARVSTLAVGAAADVRPLAAPLGARLDPYLSLGAGVLRTHVDPLTAAAAPPAARASAGFRSPLFERSTSAFALVPGVGARVAVTPAVALQAEVRDLIAFRGGARHNVAVGAGVRLTL